jgi:hypothetical protein
LEFKEEERREGLNILSGNEGVTSVYIYIYIYIKGRNLRSKKDRERGASWEVPGK